MEHQEMIDFIEKFTQYQIEINNILFQLEENDQLYLNKDMGKNEWLNAKIWLEHRLSIFKNVSENEIKMF